MASDVNKSTRWNAHSAMHGFCCISSRMDSALRHRARSGKAVSINISMAVEEQRWEGSHQKFKKDRANVTM